MNEDSYQDGLESDDWVTWPGPGFVVFVFVVLALVIWKYLNL